MAQMDYTDAHPLPFNTPQTTIYASADTMGMIRTINQYMQELAGVDLVVISPSDLPNGTGAELRALYSKFGLREKIENFVAHYTKHDAWAEIIDTVHYGQSTVSVDFDFDGIPDIAVPKQAVSNKDPMELRHAVLSQIGAEKMAALENDFIQTSWDIAAKEYVEGSAWAAGIDTDHDGLIDIGLVATGTWHATPQDFVSQFMQVSSAKITQSLPGTAADYMAFTILHESAHIGQQKQSGMVESEPSHILEIDADQKALTTYKKAIRDGKKLNPDIPQILHDVRFGTSIIANANLFESAKCGLLSGDFSNACGAPTHLTHVGLDGHGNEQDQQKEFMAISAIAATINTLQGLLAHQELDNALKNKTPLATMAIEFFGNEQTARMAIKDMQAMTQFGQFIGQQSPIANKAILDYLAQDESDTSSPVTSLRSHKTRMDLFFDRYIPGYKNDPEYTKTTANVKTFYASEALAAGGKEQRTSIPTRPAPTGNTPHF